MNIRTAKRIGRNQGILSVLIGLVVAQILMMQFSWSTNFVDSFLWFLDFGFGWNILIGIVVFFISGYFFGQLAGKTILIKKKNPYWIGILYAFLTLFTTIFLSSWVGFFQEGIDYLGTPQNPFEDYILKPVYWVMLFGTLPALLTGVWFGKQIEKKGNKTT